MNERHRWLRTWPLFFLSFFLAPVVFADPAEPLPLPATETTAVDMFNPSRRVGDLVIRPDNADVMYWAVNGVGVLKSVDGGETWVPKNNGLPSTRVARLAIDPNDFDHLLVGFGGQAQTDPPYRTHDGGERWEPTVICEREDGKENLRIQASVDVLAFDPDEADRFYYLFESEVLAFGDPPEGGYINACVTVKDAHRYTCGGFYRSCDDGASYDTNPSCEPITRPPCASGTPAPLNSAQGNDATILMFDPNSEALYVGDGLHESGGTYALMTSVDHGASFTWQDVVDTRQSYIPSAAQGVFSLFPFGATISPSAFPTKIFASTAGYLCGDGKAYPMVPNGTPPNPPLPLRCPTTATQLPPMVLRWNGNLGSATECDNTNDCDGDATRDRVWKPIYLPAAPGHAPEALLVDPLSANRIFVTVNKPTGNELIMLNAAGVNQLWNDTLMFSFGESGDPRLIQDPTTPNRFYLVTQTRLYKFTSDDNWQTWNQKDVANMAQALDITDFAEVHPPAGTRIVAATDNGVQILSELGELLNPYGGPVNFSSGHVSALAKDPSDPLRLFVKLNHSVEMSTNLFATSTSMDESRRRRDVMCTNMFHTLVIDPDVSTRVYATTGAGIWRNPGLISPGNQFDRDCNSEAWEPFARIAQGLADEYVSAMAFDPLDTQHATMIAGTGGGRVFETTNAGASWSENVVDWPGLVPDLHDVRDFRFLGDATFAASTGGVMVRPTRADPWIPSFQGDRIFRIELGVTGQHRIYAAGQNGFYRSIDAGSTWEQLPTEVNTPNSAILETVTRDGRHHLLLAEALGELKVLHTTMRAHVGDTKTQMRINWDDPGPTPYTSYRLYYGTDPDVLDGTGAAEGSSPIKLDGAEISASLTDLDFQGEKWYVALQGIDAEGNGGPRSLPLALLFDYDFSPLVAAANQVTCPPRVELQWDGIPDAAAYNIYRAPVNAEDQFTLLATVDAAGIADPYGAMSCELPGAGIAVITFTDDAPLLFNNSYKLTTVFKSTGETTGGNVAHAPGGCDEP
jgi:hypothetical protein